MHVRSMLAAACAALVLAGCEESVEAVAAPPVRAVKTLVVEGGEPAERRTFPGMLAAAEVMRLSFPVGGRLLELPLREGEAVVEGQVVAQLDPGDVEREIQAAQARVSSARARLAAVNAEYERKKSLFDSGIVAPAALDRVDADVAMARSDLRVAETELDAAEDRFDRLTLTAPRDGVVSALLANRFEEVGVGVPVYEVAVTADLQAEVLVPELLLGAIRVGSPAEVRLAAFPDLVMSATVSEIAATAEAGAAFRVKARLDDPPEGAKTGLSAAVTFALERPRGTMEVPLSSLVFDSTSTVPTAGERAKLFVVDPDTMTVGLRAVEIDGFAGNSVLVTEGLAPGEHVVTAGVALLRDGENVRIWVLPE